MESNPGLAPETMQMIMIVSLGIAFLLILVIYGLYLKNLQDVLKNVREHNRKMAPGSVWLVMVGYLNIFLAIPEILKMEVSPALETILKICEIGLTVFGLVWTFYVVNKIAESLTAELVSRNLIESGKPTYALGMFMCACNTLTLTAQVPYLVEISYIAAGAGFIAWIMYWLKTHEYKKKLAALPEDQQFDFEK